MKQKLLARSVQLHGLHVRYPGTAWADDHTKVRMRAILHSTKLWDQFNATFTSVKIALEFQKQWLHLFITLVKA